ncbi:MAG: phosphatase PAP2 family protein [Thermomicrobiales bacterium]|nr:phosphatase PAP2 family protein [Thermomicrobiales bacterium]
MSFSIFNRVPEFPDSPLRFAQLFAMLIAITVIAGLIANWRIAVALGGVALAGFLFDFAFYIPAAILVAIAATLISRLVTAGPIRRPIFAASPRDIGVFAAGFLLYEFGRSVTEGDYETAVMNAEHLLNLQIGMGLPDEARVQGWVFDHMRLMTVFNTYYSYFFLAITIGSLIWLSLNAPDVYRITRTALGIATFSALLFFAAVPMAPPRLVEASGQVGSHARVGLTHGYMNEFAAMPSLHVGWMALMGWAFYRALGGKLGWGIALFLPVSMMLTVVVTGHHYWMDGVVGAVLCVAPAIILERFPRFRVESTGVKTPHAAGTD